VRREPPGLRNANIFTFATDGLHFSATEVSAIENLLPSQAASATNPANPWFLRSILPFKRIYGIEVAENESSGFGRMLN